MTRKARTAEYSRLNLRMPAAMRARYESAATALDMDLTFLIVQTLGEGWPAVQRKLDARGVALVGETNGTAKE